MISDGRADQLIQAKTMEYRIGKLLERKDLPPIVRIRAQGTKVSIERLIQAIHDGR